MKSLHLALIHLTLNKNYLSFLHKIDILFFFSTQPFCIHTYFYLENELVKYSLIIGLILIKFSSPVVYL